MKEKCRYNKLKLSRLLLSAIFAGLVMLLSNSCNQTQNDTVASATSKSAYIYYCPMHSDVKQDHPGKCPYPECGGMELLVKDTGDVLMPVLKPVSSNVLSKVNLTSPQYKSLPVFTEAFGYLDYDNNGKSNVSSRFSGRIEKLYVKYNFQPVKKGDILFEIYSPDLVTAQENLLYLLKNSPDDTSLIASARQKLKLLQLTNAQIKAIEISGKVKLTIAIYSRQDGHIHEMLDSQTNSGMNGYQQTTLVMIKEGMYVDREQVLFNIADPTKLVAIVQIKSSDISKIKAGQRVSLTVNNDSNNVINGTVDFIIPVFAENSKTLNARINLDNSNKKYKVGSLVNARITADSLESLWVPTAAIVDLGKNKIAWVWKNGYFQARKVETGMRAGGMIEIADGLTEADKIAGEAHFLSDSEGFIKISSDE